jgi:hypothetical protein
MSTRIQLALLKQLERQMRNMARRENQRLHMELRHRIQQQRLIDEEFTGREYDAIGSFDAYYHRIKEAIEINKTRFDLCLDEKINRIFENHYEPKTIYEFADAEFENASKKMFYDANQGLFFQNLYSSTVPSGGTYNNDTFYAVITFITAFLIANM